MVHKSNKRIETVRIKWKSKVTGITVKRNKQNNRKQTPKPVTGVSSHELPTNLSIHRYDCCGNHKGLLSKHEPAEIVKKLFMMGVMATQNPILGWRNNWTPHGGLRAKQKRSGQCGHRTFLSRMAILMKMNWLSVHQFVTIIGHVDHGKTTLLDTLRNSRVATGEAGNHSTYRCHLSVVENSKKITFLDTPPRTRGLYYACAWCASIDNTILVVAADDEVMPQTIEAINHSQKRRSINRNKSIRLVNQVPTRTRYRWICRAWGYVNSLGWRFWICWISAR